MGKETLLQQYEQYLKRMIEDKPDANKEFRMPVVKPVQSGHRDSPEGRKASL